MKLLGVLGGMSWTSTAEYYRLLNQGVAARLGGLHSARLLLHSVDFEPVVAMQHHGDWDGTAALLVDAARGLERADVHRIIYDELCLDVVLDASRDRFRDVMNHLVQRGAECIILGCTEIGLLVAPGDASVPLYDTTAIHAEQAVDWMLAP